MKLKSNVLWLSLSMVFFASCLKNNDSYKDSENVSAIEVINASSGSTSLDVALDGNRLYANYFNFGNRINYFRAFTGTRNFKVFNNNLGNSSTAIFSKDIVLNNGKYYSAFIVDTAAKMDVIVLKDSTRGAGRDSVRIRFANMSPDAPAIDLYANGAETPIVTNISYKTASEFISFPSKANVIFDIKPTGKNTLLATLEPINLFDGYVYTIWAGGYVSGSSAEGKQIKLKSFSH